MPINANMLVWNSLAHNAQRLSGQMTTIQVKYDKKGKYISRFWTTYLQIRSWWTTYIVQKEEKMNVDCTIQGNQISVGNWDIPP